LLCMAVLLSPTRFRLALGLLSKTPLWFLLCEAFYLVFAFSF